MNECPMVFHWANLQNQGLQTLLRSSLKDPVEHCFWKSHGLFSSGPLILSYRGMLTAAFTVGIFGANMGRPCTSGPLVTAEFLLRATCGFQWLRDHINGRAVIFIKHTFPVFIIRLAVAAHIWGNRGTHGTAHRSPNSKSGTPLGTWYKFLFEYVCLWHFTCPMCAGFCVQVFA